MNNKKFKTIAEANKDWWDESMEFIKTGKDNDGNLLPNYFIKFAKFQLDLLYEEIKHGDDEHQKWLKDKIEEFKNKIK